MYGLAIGPYAHGNSMYNRYAENKETIVPRHATKRTNYDRIHPYRPVEPRGVPKQEFVPPLEREPSFNLVFNRPDGPKTRLPPVSDGGQQFNPPSDSSNGVIPPTTPVDSSIGAIPPVDSKGWPKGWLADLLQNSLGNPNIDHMKSDYIDGQREQGYEAAGESAAKGVRTFMSGLGNVGSKIAPYIFELDEVVVKEENVDTMFAPLNTRDDLIGAVKYAPDQLLPENPESDFTQAGAGLRKTLKAAGKRIQSFIAGDTANYHSVKQMIKEEQSKVKNTIASNSVTSNPAIVPPDPRILHSGGLKKKPEMSERKKKKITKEDFSLLWEDYGGPSTRTRSKSKTIINKF